MPCNILFSNRTRSETFLYLKWVSIGLARKPVKFNLLYLWMQPYKIHHNLYRGSPISFVSVKKRKRAHCMIWWQTAHFSNFFVKKTAIFRQKWQKFRKISNKKNYFFLSKDLPKVGLYLPWKSAPNMYSYVGFCHFCFLKKLKKKFSPEKSSKISIFVPLGAHTGGAGAGLKTSMCGL